MALHMATPAPGDHVAVTGFDAGVPPRQEVRFADGSNIWLHRVWRNGAPDLFLRRLGQPEPSAIEVDLRRLAPELAADLRIAATRDVPGTVHFALRHKYKSADALLVAALQNGAGARQ